MYSPTIRELIKAFTLLPSVGQRTAERFVFHLLKSGKKDVAELISALQNLVKNTRSCQECWDFADSSPCLICSDIKRDKNLLCVVSDPQDVQVIERTKTFNGIYHVLRGVIKPEDPETNKDLKITDLIKRINAGTDIKEVILALNPDLPGETTMMFLEKKLKQTNPKIVISRLARGLPMGSDLQYADEITLSSAFKNRLKT